MEIVSQDLKTKARLLSGQVVSEVGHRWEVREAGPVRGESESAHHRCERDAASPMFEGPLSIDTS